MNSLENMDFQIKTVDKTNSRVSLLIHIFTERFNYFFALNEKYRETDKKSEYWFKNDGADEDFITEEAETITKLWYTMTKNEDTEQIVNHLKELCTLNDSKYERGYEPTCENSFEWLW